MFASQRGVSFEIVSQVLLWCKSFRTTQVYLGCVMDLEVLR
jgi:hypothetical protein